MTAARSSPWLKSSVLQFLRTCHWGGCSKRQAVRSGDFPKQRFQFGLIQRHRFETLFSATVFGCGERLAQPESALYQVAHLTGITRQAKGNHRFGGKFFSD